MRTKQKSDLGGELRKTAEKESDQVLLYGAALIVVHLLNIAPTEISALGAKVTLSSPIMLRGVIAVLLLHKVHMMVINMRYAFAFGEIYTADRQVARYTLRKHMKVGRSAKVMKRWTRFDLTVWGLLFAPYAMIVFGFLILAVVLAASDLIAFAVYCFENAPALQKLKADGYFE